jgi:hypothetical protein
MPVARALGWTRREEQHRPADQRKTERGYWISMRKKESTLKDNIV